MILALVVSILFLLFIAVLVVSVIALYKVFKLDVKHANNVQSLNTKFESLLLAINKANESDYKYDIKQDTDIEKLEKRIDALI